jgi:apolipoprotein N-acyltransferase
MRGWFRLLAICLFSGVLWSLAHPSAPPIITKTSNIILNTGWQEIIAWFGMVPMIFALRRQNGWKLWWGSFAFGLGFFSLSIYWLNIAIVLFGNIPLFFSFLIYGALVLACTALWAWAIYVAIKSSQLFKYRLSWTLPIAFVAVELSRNFIPFKGFPWSNMAYSQYFNIPLLQTAAIWGVYGILFLIVLSNVLLVELTDWWHSKRDPALLPKATLALFLGLMAFSYSYGIYRLHANQEAEDAAPHFKAAVIQGNIDQEIKNQSTEHARAILNVYKELSAQVPAYAQLVVWPEAAYPYSIPRESNYLKRLFEDEYDRLPWALLTGVSNYTNGTHGRRFYNSAYALDRNMNVSEIFDKSHLVPFGEYVPYQELLGISQIVPEAGMFYPGQLGDGMQVDGLNMGVLICYEGIFPEITRSYSRIGVEFLVNLTNDAWYGVSSAPYQHLAFYAFRSVEARKATVRAANTGVSALIDSSGRILHPSHLFTRTWLLLDVPKLTERTIYSYLGDWPPALISMIWIFWWLKLIRVRRNSKALKTPKSSKLQKR